MRRILSLTGVLGLLASLVLGGTALAAQPEFETVVVGPDTFLDEFLTDECGIEVWTTATGRVKFRAFDDGPAGVLELATINVALEARAGDNVFRFRDVGADQLRLEPDGTLVLSIIGQIPFGWTGVLKLDPETDAVILEPSHFIDTSAACAVLSA